MRLAAIALWVVMLASACGDGGSEADAVASGSETTVQSGPSEPVGDFFKRQFEYRLWGQHQRAWEELHPGQRALTPKALYVHCMHQENPDVYPSLEVESVNVLTMYAADEPPPVGVDDETLAVTMRVTIVDPGVHRETTTERLHTVTVDGRFVWMLPSEAVRAFEMGKCPAQ